jgi:hypothetical protein
MPVIIDRFYDQTADWEADRSLHFDVGTIFVGGVWEVNFSMKVLKDGNIKILDSNSTIKFNDGSELPLPDTYITARPDNSGSGPMGMGIHVTDVRRTDDGTNPDYVTIAWNVSYTGFEAQFLEKVEILRRGELPPWDTRYSEWVDWSTTDGEVTLDISSLSSGTYDVWVSAYATDTGEDRGPTYFDVVKAERTPKIKIS